MLFAQSLKPPEQREHFVAHRLQLVPEQQLYVHQDLVVAGTAGMDLLADVPEPAGEQDLHLRVDVLHVVFQAEGPGCDFCRDIVESLVQDRVLVFAQQSYGCEHPDVGLRAHHVVLCEPLVEDAVVADSEFLHHLFGLGAFIPQCCHSKSL